MNKLFTVLALILANFCFGQYEVLSPIGSRSELQKKENHSVKNLGSTIDGLFVYGIDTLALPLFDDFTKNHFQQYDAQPGDPDVTSTIFHALLNLDNTPFPDGTTFTLIPSYRINITLQPIITRDTIFFNSIPVKFNNLAVYPVVHEEIQVFPPYFLVDTLDLNKPAPDTIWILSNLRQQNQAEVFFVDVDEPDSWWVDHDAHWNFTRAKLPWSLGVVTFDGLKANGFPYAINTNQSGYADFLTSKPLKMGFPTSDSIYLTFLYQPEGFGDRPEPNDSLILEFFNVTDQKWETVWKVNGSPVHDFKLVHIPITQNKFLQDGFRFRFKNFGGLSGDLDNWHIDYVRLRRFSSQADTNISDFAVVYPIPTLLKEFTSVPWEHYLLNPTGHMSDSLLITVRNSNLIAGNTSNGNLRVFDENTLIQDYVILGGSLTTDLNYEPRTTYTTQHSLVALAPAFNFPVSDPDAENYTFDYHFRATVPFPQLSQENDTVFGLQYFANYYSYDDGSAELAYGINGEQSRLAYQFTPILSDTVELVAVQMNFVPTVFDHSNKLFMLTIWGDNNGKPGAVLYEDNFFTVQSPVYIPEKNSFWHYYFKENMKVKVSGTFYVGWRQLDPERLNIGFDRNTNTQNRIFFSIDLGNTWQNSSFQGSLMMRPVFSTAMDVYLGLDDLDYNKEELMAFPNPVKGTLQFSFAHEGHVEIFGPDGKMVKTMVWDNSVDLTDLNPGFYFVRVRSRDGQFDKSFKIIKS
jgi:hypothetical protein